MKKNVKRLTAFGSRLMANGLLLFLLAGMCLGALSGTYGGGAGTEASPALIDDAADWAELVATSADWSYYFQLTANIDFGDGTTEIGGVGSATIPFSGTFDGNGYVFQDFTRATGLVKNSVGLFHLSSGTVKNLTVSNATITGDTSVVAGSCYAAAIVGENAETGIIDNCTVIDSLISLTTNINQLAYVGPIAGANHGTVKNCNVFGGFAKLDNTDGASKINALGGIVGYHTYTSVSYLEDCYSSTTLSDVAAATDNYIYIGGVAGAVSSTAARVRRCRFEGLIDYESAAMADAQITSIGGIVGYVVAAYIEDCSASGVMDLKVGGDGRIAYVGGIIGYHHTSAPIGIRRCSADFVTKIARVHPGTLIRYGGAVGYNYRCSWIDCIVSGTVYDLDATPITVPVFEYLGGFVARSIESTATPVYTRCIANIRQHGVGGAFVGTNTNGTYVNCLWNSTASRVASDAITGTTPKTQTELMAISTYSGWSISRGGNNNTWKIADGYLPILAWQSYPLQSVEEGFYKDGLLLGGGKWMGE